MNEEMWAELLAQVEEHGHDAITFLLDESDNTQFDVTDVSYATHTAGAIVVTLNMRTA